MSRRLTRVSLVAVLAAVAIVGSLPSSAEAQASMQPRFDLLFRLGFAGNIQANAGGVSASSSADSSPGADLRGDIPVHRFVTLGPKLAVYGVRAKFPGLERNPVVDVSAFVKGRYPFRAKKKKAEVYGLFQFGLSMVFLRASTGATDRFGAGYNVGLTSGFQILLARRFGLVTELGWLRTQGNFDPANLILNQGVWRVGFVF